MPRKPVEYTKFEKSLVEQERLMRLELWREPFRDDERIEGCYCSEHDLKHLNRSHIGTNTHICKQLGISIDVDSQLKHWVRHRGGRVKHRPLFHLLQLHENLVGPVTLSVCQQLYAKWKRGDYDKED